MDQNNQGSDLISGRETLIKEQTNNINISRVRAAKEKRQQDEGSGASMCPGG